MRPPKLKRGWGKKCVSQHIMTCGYVMAIAFDCHHQCHSQPSWQTSMPRYLQWHISLDIYNLSQPLEVGQHSIWLSGHFFWPTDTRKAASPGEQWEGVSWLTSDAEGTGQQSHKGHDSFDHSLSVNGTHYISFTPAAKTSLMQLVAETKAVCML